MSHRKVSTLKLTTIHVCGCLALNEGQKENKTMEEMRVNKKGVVLAALVLALMFPILTQQAFTEENANYVYPTIEFDAIQLNATAYRFYSGDTLNFTFTFITKEGVLAICPENYTDCYSAKGDAYLHITKHLDGRRTSSGSRYKGGSGSGWAHNQRIQTVRTAGNHTINYNWLFLADEDPEAYLDINFLTEVRLKIEKLPTEPIPTQTLLAIGAGGAGVGAAIVAATSFLNKRRNKRSKEEQS